MYKILCILSYHCRFTLCALLMAAFSMNALGSSLSFALTPETADPTPIYDQELENADSKVLKTRVRYARRLNTPSKHYVWLQLVKLLEAKSGLDIDLIFPKSRLEFERGLAMGSYDLAYMTPLQFVAAEQAQKYRAMAKRKAQSLRALILVKKFDKARTLRDIETSAIGYSSLLDYSSSVITRYSLERLDLHPPIQLFESDASLTNALLNKQIRSISIAEATFKGLAPDQQEKMKILWETPGFTAFPIAAHPRVPFYSINKLQRALVNLNRGANKQELLHQLHARNGFEVARNSDWLDAEGIDIDELNLHLNIAPQSPANTLEVQQ